MPIDLREWPGPVVWWHPTHGQRHAFRPDQRPDPGQHRHTLCGHEVTLTPVTEVDWLLPTCPDCMSLARDRSDARNRWYR